MVLQMKAAIILDHIEYDNADILMKDTKEVQKGVKGDTSKMKSEARLTRLTLDPLNGKLINREVILNKNCEFPTIVQNGKKYKNSFLS